MSDRIVIERRLKPEQCNPLLSVIAGTRWKRIAEGQNVDKALEAYAKVSSLPLGKLYDYRMVTPVGIINLDVVRP